MRRNVCVDQPTSSTIRMLVLTPSTAADGRKLAFHGADGVYVMNADGSRLTRIWSGHAMRPAWRPLPR
jgi:hypothetical protein